MIEPERGGTIRSQSGLRPHQLEKHSLLVHQRTQLEREETTDDGKLN